MMSLGRTDCSLSWLRKETPYCLLEGRDRLTAIENLNDLSMCLDFKLQLHCVLRMAHSTVLRKNDHLRIVAQKMHLKMKHLHLVLHPM